MIRNQYTSGKFDRIANAKRWIAERAPGFEYVGNFTGVDGRVDLKCKTCGTVATYPFISVRTGYATCKACKQKEREWAEAERTRLREIERKAKQEERKREIEQARQALREQELKPRKCPWCGKTFKPYRKGLKYCTAECGQRANDNIKKDRRIRKRRTVIVDRGITLEKLYQRDNGVCAICGGLCDWNDHERREDGTFIVKNYYPSIDHIQPLSMGGVHSWENVRLAHFICNSVRGNTPTVPVNA